MASNSEWASIANPATSYKPQVVIVLEFAQEARYLRSLMQQYGGDTSEEFTLAILQLIVGEVFDYANQWVSCSKLEMAIEELRLVTQNQDFAYDVCRTLHDMISAKVCHYIPNFGLHLQEQAYTYSFMGSLNAQIQIQYFTAQDFTVR